MLVQSQMSFFIITSWSLVNSDSVIILVKAFLVQHRTGSLVITLYLSAPEAAPYFTITPWPLLLAIFPPHQT